MLVESTWAAGFFSAGSSAVTESSPPQPIDPKMSGNESKKLILDANKLVMIFFDGYVVNQLMIILPQSRLCPKVGL